jgi:DNA-binding NtrC family response regulator
MLEVLLGDSDIAVRRALAAALYDAGHRVLEAGNGPEAIGLARDHVFDVVVCDVALPRAGGLGVFRHFRRESPATAVIVTASAPTVADAVAALKEGAVDFLTKPFDCEELARGAVARIAERRALKQSFETARTWLVGRIVGAALIGSSPAMTKLMERVDTIAQSDCAVLIKGELGTGKDILARTLYARSRRAARPFVTVDCARRPLDLLEHDLFGEGGQLAAAARGGTIFFEAIGELPLAVQSRLAQVLRDGARDGGAPLDMRILSATHHDLRARVASGEFREDLFYRLAVLDLDVPPLRERKSDLPLLLGHFLERLTPPGQVAPGLSPYAWAALAEYSFPGNVRELARTIEHALALSHGSEIDVAHLPPEIAGSVVSAPHLSTLAPLTIARREFEREYLLRTLKLCGGELDRAADMLGMKKDSLLKRLRKHGIADGAGSPGSRNSIPPTLLGPVKASIRPCKELARGGLGLELGEGCDPDADGDAQVATGRLVDLNG